MKGTSELLRSVSETNETFAGPKETRRKSKKIRSEGETVANKQFVGVENGVGRGIERHNGSVKKMVGAG
jgi:hypothetical protein